MTETTVKSNTEPEIDPVKLARYRAKFDEEGMASIYPTSSDAPVIVVPAY